jgi:hypothetical protein
MIKKLSCLFLLFVLFGCAPSVKSNFIDTSNSLMLVEKIIFLNVYDVVPVEAIRIGQAKYGDTGISTDCGCRANFSRAKELARKNKSNIVKLIKFKKPSSASTCCRIEVEFYYYEGDLSKLDQIKTDF